MLITYDDTNSVPCHLNLSSISPSKVPFNRRQGGRFLNFRRQVQNAIGEDSWDRQSSLQPHPLFQRGPRNRFSRDSDDLPTRVHRHSTLNGCFYPLSEEEAFGLLPKSANPLWSASRRHGGPTP